MRTEALPAARRMALLAPLALLAPVAVAVVIFLGSARSGWHVSAQLPGLADLFPGIPVRALDLYVKKTVHVGEYFTLTAAALFGLLRLRPGRPWPRALAAVAIAAAFAITDELHQAFVPGRFPSARDVLIDLCGALAAVAAWTAAQAVRGRIRPGFRPSHAGGRLLGAPPVAPGAGAD